MVSCFLTGAVVNFEELVTHYGYIALLIGTFLEGETILVIGGLLAHRGYLELPYVIASAFAGTFFGDQLYFYIGRIKGKKFIDSRPLWQAKSRRVLALLEKHQTLLILGFRFIYGIRTVTPFVLGSIGISPLRYLLLNICGALLWAMAIGILGFYFGQALELVIGEVKRYEKAVIATLLFLSAVIWLFLRWRDKKATLKDSSKTAQ
jgi:membrane protein DedA with SNARE-associated domain